MADKKSGKKTNAMRLLDGAHLAYQVLAYDCDGIHLEGEFVAQQLGLPMGQVFKTLVLQDDKGQHLVCCIPVSGSLNTKALAAVWGSKSISLIPLKALQPLTGYIRGACSPIGMKKAFPTFVDESALAYEAISVSAGQRGLQLFLSPKDLIKYLGAQTGGFSIAENS